MIDIDHFKQYNDKHGHIAGDILLEHLARLFISIVEKGDMVARYGGEEFVIMLFDADRDRSMKIAEKIRAATEKEPFYLRRADTHATVSIGVSTLPVDGVTGEGLLKAADENLYRAKHGGRNKVCVSG